MATSGGLFLVGSLPSIIPFVLLTSVGPGLENVIEAGGGGVLAWGIDRIFGTTVS